MTQILAQGCKYDPHYAFVALLDNSCHEGTFSAFTTSMHYVTGSLLFLGANNGAEAFRPETPDKEHKETKATNTLMNSAIFGSILSLLVIFHSVPSNGYDDDLPIQKWSPDYFSYRFFPQQKSNYKRRVQPSYIQSFTPNVYGSSRPSWHVGAMGTMYKRVSQQ